jgi:vitamin B12 transporter
VLSPAWTLRVRLDNLFDRDYALVHGYNTPGRSLSISAAWQPH